MGNDRYQRTRWGRKTPTPSTTETTDERGMIKPEYNASDQRETRIQETAQTLDVVDVVQALTLWSLLRDVPTANIMPALTRLGKPWVSGYNVSEAVTAWSETPAGARLSRKVIEVLRAIREGERA